MLHTSAHTTDGLNPFPPTGRRGWQTIALVAGGAVFAAGNLLHPLQHTDAAYNATTWKAAHLLIFFSLPLLVLGLPVLYKRLLPRLGRLRAGLPVAATVVGLIGIAPGTIIETFVAPMIGHEAMERLEAGGMGVVDAVFGTAFIGGTFALAWATRCARLRPRWAAPSLFIAATALIVVMSATGPAAGVVIISATIVYGLTLAMLALGV